MEEKINVNVGERIKARREELGMKQETLARLIGYRTKASISQIELGTRDVQRSKVVEIARALNTTPSYIMGWDDSNGVTTLMNQSFSKTTGERVATAREESNLTQKQLSELSDVPLDKIQQIESGNDREYSSEIMFKICEALNVPYSYFIVESLPAVDSKVLGSNLLTLLSVNKISSKDFSEASGMSEDRINSVIYSVSPLKFSEIELITQFFRVEVSTFLTYDFSKMISINKEFAYGLRLAYCKKFIDDDILKATEDDLKLVWKFFKFLRED